MPFLHLVRSKVNVAGQENNVIICVRESLPKQLRCSEACGVNGLSATKGLSNSVITLQTSSKQQLQCGI